MLYENVCCKSTVSFSTPVGIVAVPNATPQKSVALYANNDKARPARPDQLYSAKIGHQAESVLKTEQPLSRAPVRLATPALSRHYEGFLFPAWDNGSGRASPPAPDLSRKMSGGRLSPLAFATSDCVRGAHGCLTIAPPGFCPPSRTRHPAGPSASSPPRREAHRHLRRNKPTRLRRRSPGFRQNKAIEPPAPRNTTERTHSPQPPAALRPPAFCQNKATEPPAPRNTTERTHSLLPPAALRTPAFCQNKATEPPAPRNTTERTHSPLSPSALRTPAFCRNKATEPPNSS